MVLVEFDIEIVGDRAAGTGSTASAPADDQYGRTIIVARRRSMSSRRARRCRSSRAGRPATFHRFLAEPTETRPAAPTSTCRLQMSPPGHLARCRQGACKSSRRTIDRTVRLRRHRRRLIPIGRNPRRAAGGSAVEQWVAEEAGVHDRRRGLAHTATWALSPEHGKISRAYPVGVSTAHGRLLDDGPYARRRRGQIDFTQGKGWRPTFFFRLGDTPEENSRAVGTLPRASWLLCGEGAEARCGKFTVRCYSDPEGGSRPERLRYFAISSMGAGRWSILYAGRAVAVADA